MKVWVLTVIHDDGDPFDRAKLWKLLVFRSLDDGRSALLKEIEGMVVNEDEADLLNDYPEFNSKEEFSKFAMAHNPELHEWTNNTDEHWSGGSVVELSYKEVQ